MEFRSVLTLFLALAILWIGPASAAPLSLASANADAVGLHTSFLKEENGRLGLEEVVAAEKAGRFTPSHSPVMNFGIGSKPVWIRLAVDNPTAVPLRRRLSIETAWLDSVEVYFRYRGTTTATYAAGDAQAFHRRPVHSRFFAFDHVFESGTGDVYLRIETPDPMVVPIHLMGLDEARIRESRQELSYGIVYGYLCALMAYNFMLYLSLRSSRYLFYSLYLGMFMIMNIAYTGHGFEWIWPESVKWELWSNPTLIFLYGASGLLFAIRFLDLREHFPRVYRMVVSYCLASAGLLATTVLLGSQRDALLVSFTFVFLFTCVMLLLGVISVYANQKPAKYFLLAAAAAMVGAGLTTLSTWGFIPYTTWAFRAVEMGMLADATLLALALAYQFQALEEAKVRAEQLAHLDLLTGLCNRRAFYEKAEPLWSTAIRKGRPASVILMDIDKFKHINDTYGHALGDEALVAIAGALMKSIRQADVLARWGGEEFIVFLPETDIHEAAALAERLRGVIAGIVLRPAKGEAAVTASIGVAQRESHHGTLDALISAADNRLYQSKEEGRNRVSYSAA